MGKVPLLFIELIRICVETPLCSLFLGRFKMGFFFVYSFGACNAAAVSCGGDITQLAAWGEGNGGY